MKRTYVNDQGDRVIERSDPYGCASDFDNDEVAEVEHAAHEEGECGRGCVWCEAEALAFESVEDREIERLQPVCSDCGEKALPGYVAGDRCDRKVTCGGRLELPGVWSTTCCHAQLVDYANLCEKCLEPSELAKEESEGPCPSCAKLQRKDFFCPDCGFEQPKGDR